MYPEYRGISVMLTLAMMYAGIESVSLGSGQVSSASMAMSSDQICRVSSRLEQREIGEGLAPLGEW
jgi:hypothetical protein